MILPLSSSRSSWLKAALAGRTIPPNHLANRSAREVTAEFTYTAAFGEGSGKAIDSLFEPDNNALCPTPLLIFVNWALRFLRVRQPRRDASHSILWVDLTQ